MAVNLVDVQKTAKTVTMYTINTGWCHAAHAAVSHFIYSQSLAWEDMSHICILAGTTALDLPSILCQSVACVRSLIKSTQLCPRSVCCQGVALGMQQTLHVPHRSASGNNWCSLYLRAGQQLFKHGNLYNSLSPVSDAFVGTLHCSLCKRCAPYCILSVTSLC
jgi:hypothetical protein